MVKGRLQSLNMGQNLEGVIAMTTLGDSLEELPTSLFWSIFYAQDLVFQEVLIRRVDHFGFTI